MTMGKLMPSSKEAFTLYKRHIAKSSKEIVKKLTDII
jgi:hypothetical protein